MIVINQFSRRWITLPALALLTASVATAANSRMDALLPQPATTPQTQTAAASEPLIQLAVLLDTSGSMEGLIDQARCQLWTAVSQVAKARRNGQPVRLEIAVYQYGTDSVSKSKGALRKVCDFTDDLDQVSAALFGLHVKGGDEYCGEVITRAVTDLDWATESDVYKAIFIAGNESFQQGDVTFAKSLPLLAERGVVVNTIFCQSSKYRADEIWKLAATASGGLYSLIDHNHHLPSIPTPMDEDLVRLNDEMNETFVWFGRGADKAASNQKMQDLNARKLSAHAFAARMSSKVGHLYHHVDHDLIDALQHEKVSLAKMPVDKMPETLQAMTAEERVTYLTGLMAKRQSIRRRMADVISSRHNFLMKELNGQQGQPVVLGDALTGIITSQATDRGFEFSGDVKVTQTP